MDETVKLRIVREAAGLFQAKGYRNVTLSELAARLGMSKKTLYQYFGGKEEIAEAVMGQTMKAIADVVAESAKQGGDPLRVLQETFGGIRNEITKLSPLFLEDLQKFVPGLWEQVEAFRARQMVFIEELLVKAKEAGSIRDVNPRLAAAIMMETIQRMARPDFAARQGVTMSEVADTLFVLFIEGLRADGKK
ncbi:TetR/AcrR family transcriptional regulator [Paenibacillus hamazuiensis]|uniref:TetR/AcrR family transcriptional regulator n=1 Tax=Paenibacillus hamazuiensis TaxID=2936508 RepID=UPI00200EBB5D|nr:TetR/AcrR family transcriptional regulator [Paenibacillus hamazuiensis]